ncbi:MAG: GAF domain-containing sensor histidine kinase, partial [Deltaproteobacteria bacterium]
MNSQIRTTLPKQLRTLSEPATRISRPSGKTLHRLGFRDKLGELAAAFDRLAETLREKQTPPQDNKAAFKDPAAWLSTLSRFNRRLRACPDLPSIERLLVETVENQFPACAIALRLSDKSGSFAPPACHNIAEGLPVAKAQLETTRIPSAPTESRMLPRSQSGFCRPKVESWSKDGWTSYVTIPLLARGEALGALSVHGPKHEGLSPLELDFLNVLADQAALAIDKFQLLEPAIEQAVQSGHVKDASARSNRAKSDFVGILSHEFRTPLNLIMGYCGMMHEELMGKITPEQGTCLERIMKASDDLAALVMNMVQVSNIESGCVEVNKTKVRLSQLLREIQSDLVLPQEKKLTLIWDTPPDLPIFSTDADKLKQVLQQLIG